MLSKFLTKRKIALLLLLLFLFSAVFSKPIQAFSTETVRGGYLFNFEGAVFKTEEMNLQSFVNETFKALGASIWTSIVGCLSCTEEERERYPGFIVTIGNLMAGISTSPPASGVQYLAYIGNRLGVAKTVYAQEQTIGFQAMEKILPIWTAFRNISYVFFVLILIFMGFAIMFRVKISPQAVITIQSAIPRIVLALILITFSYAIVGFMIDLMYVLSALISNVFIGEDGIIATQFRLGPALVSLSNLARHLAPDSALAANAASVVFFILATLLILIISLFLGPITFLFSLITVILILIALVRCLWTLLKAWAMIIVNLIFAPFLILVGVLPGSGAIGSWFRNLLANMVVLPAMFAMFHIAAYLTLSGIAGIWQEGPVAILGAIFAGWLSPLGPILLSFLQVTGHATPWDFFAILILPLVGLMILFMAPNVSNIIQSFIRGRPFEYGAAIGQAVGPITGAAALGWGAGRYEAGRRIVEAPPAFLAKIDTRLRESVGAYLGYKKRGP